MSLRDACIVKVGDIVAYHNPQAGKLKYHLCVFPVHGESAACFLFINSGDLGYKDDCVFEDGVFACLPKSRTGKTIVSMSTIVRANQRQLDLFGAEVIQVCPKAVANHLKAFSATVRALTRAELSMVQAALEKISD